MVAHSKHHKPIRRNKQPEHPRARGSKPVAMPQPVPQLPPARPRVVEEELPNEEEEPKPEDLAKEEEALKAEEAAEAAAAGHSAPEPEDHVEPRSRERSSYDGDTAINLRMAREALI